MRIRIVSMALAAGLAFTFLSASGADAARWGRNYFPDVRVVTQHGKSVHFYDDLLKDKIFVINFLYTSCRDFCPLVAARLSLLQEELADVMGRKIFFYSISIQPEVDTPEKLKEYAETFQAGPGWLFLTGKPEDIQAIRYKLGDRSKILSEHRNEILLGNGATGQWARNNVLGDLKRLEFTIRSMDPKWRRVVAGASRTGPPAMVLDLSKAQPGQALFKRLCAGCHTVGGGDRVGPDLAGVMGRRDTAWLKKFISEPEKMRRQKDPVALALVAKYPAVRMPPLGIGKKGDVADLLAYIAYLEKQLAKGSAPLETLFGLTTHKGERLSPKDVEGKLVAVFFGFTHCPDVCPTTLADWSNVLADLGADGDRLKVLFVSVDSQRDKPEALAAYMASFDPRITALTGSTADVAKAARAFDAYYERVAQAGDGYTFDHGTKVHLVGKDGQVAARVDLRTPAAKRQGILADLLSKL